MKRTTVRLPDELDAQLRHEAKRRQCSVSVITREALEAYLAGGSSGGHRRRLLAAKAGRSGLDHIFERIDEIPPNRG